MLKLADISLFENITTNRTLPLMGVFATSENMPSESIVVFNEIGAYINRLLDKNPALRKALSKNLNDQQLEAIVYFYLQGMNADALNYVKNTNGPNEYLDPFLKLFLIEISDTIKEPGTKLKKKWYRSEDKRIGQLKSIASEYGSVAEESYTRGLHDYLSRTVKLPTDLKQANVISSTTDDLNTETERTQSRPSRTIPLPTLALSSLMTMLGKELNEDLIYMRIRAQQDGVQPPNITEIGKQYMLRLNSQVVRVQDAFQNMMKQLATLVSLSVN